MRRRRRSAEAADTAVYDEEYFLSDACEGFREFRGGDVSWVKKREIELLDARSGSLVLDVGCGRGEVVAALTHSGVRAVALDRSEAAVSLTKRTAPAVPVVLADATALPFRTAVFDRVLMGDVIEHIPWPLAVETMREIGRVVSPNGYALVHTAPNAWFARTVIPFVRSLLPLFGARATDVRLRMNQYGRQRKVMHPNELSPLGLRRLVRRARLHGTVWVDSDVARSGESPWTSGFAATKTGRFLARIASMPAFKLLLGNDLYARVRSGAPR